MASRLLKINDEFCQVFLNGVIVDFHVNRKGLCQRGTLKH